MDIKATKNEDVVEINIKDLGDAKARVMKSLGKCQAGKCSCKSKEYDKLEKMEILEGDNGLTVKLSPKSGEDLDVDEINKCAVNLK